MVSLDGFFVCDESTGYHVFLTVHEAIHEVVDELETSKTERRKRLRAELNLELVDRLSTNLFSQSMLIVQDLLSLLQPSSISASTILWRVLNFSGSVRYFLNTLFKYITGRSTSVSDAKTLGFGYLDVPIDVSFRKLECNRSYQI